MMRLSTLIAAAAIAISSVASAADIKPAVVYDMGGKFDKSFNEGVWNGVQKFTEETGIEVMEFEVTNETQREQAIRRMAERGATVVLGVGFAQADAIAKVSAEFPDTQFLRSLMSAGLMVRTCASMSSRNMRAAISSVLLRPKHPRAARSGLSAAWIFR